MNHMRQLDWETHLVERAQQGEVVAFELLADCYRDALRAQAMRTLRQSDDAHDAVQETLLKAFRAIKSFQPGRPVQPWLARICSNCCVDILRQRKGGTRPLDQYEFALTGDDDLEQGAEDAYDGEVVRGAVNRLPRHYREIIVMRHFRQMEVNEIAQALDKPEGTVKSWLFRARALLRRELEPELGIA